VTVPEFNEDQYDALGEICNLAMGEAGAALATLLDVFVRLSVPSVRVLSADEILDFLCELDEADQEVAVVRQSFYGGVSGEVIALHSRGRSEDVADLFGYDDNSDDEREREVLLDVSNMLIGAVVNGILKQLNIEIGFSSPSLLNERVKLKDLNLNRNPSWHFVLLCEVNFQLEERQFAVRQLIFLPDESFEIIQLAVDEFLEDLE